VDLVSQILDRPDRALWTAATHEQPSGKSRTIRILLKTRCCSCESANQQRVLTHLVRGKGPVLWRDQNVKAGADDAFPNEESSALSQPQVVWGLRFRTPTLCD
jgi:hypothetical protein